MTEYSDVFLAELTSLIARTYVKRDEQDTDIGDVLPTGWTDVNFGADYPNALWLAEQSMGVEVYRNGNQYVIEC
jgi:hypothetical protein